MIRIDFLGVPGVGKSTIYHLLSQTRQKPSEFLLFEEAYHSALEKQLSFVYRRVNLLKDFLVEHQISKPLLNILERRISSKIFQERVKFERNVRFDQVLDLWFANKDYLKLRIDGVGKQVLEDQSIEPSEYLFFLIQTATRMNQFHMLERYTPEKSIVVIDKSFSQKVLSVVDFSKRIDPDKILRYIKAMPKPAGVIIFSASPEIIVERTRQRAGESHVIKGQVSIVNSDRIHEWIEIANEVVRCASQFLQEQGVKVFFLDTDDQPIICAQKARELILQSGS